MSNIQRKGEVKDTGKWYMLYISICVGVANNFFYSNSNIMLCLVLVELLMLGFFLIKGYLDKFACYFVLFLSSSLENGFQVSGEEIRYGFKAFKIMGINISVYVLLFFAIYYILKYQKIIFFKFKPLKNLLIGSILLIPIGFISGAISILNNYNNIRSYKGYFFAFLRQGYTYTLITFEIFVFAQIIFYSKSIKFFKNRLLYMALGQIFAAFISLFMHNYSYTYGKVTSIIAPITLIHLVFLILFPMYQDYSQKEKCFLFIIAVTNTLSTIVYAGGQEILMIAIIPVLMLIIFWQTCGIKKKILIIMVGVMLGMLLMPIILSINLEYTGNNKLAEELGDTISMLSFWKPDWIKNMHHSPKVRVVEIVNIVHEYMQNPASFIFGRGFLGTYKDGLHLLDIVVPEDYSIWERSLGVYSGVHESFAQFLLYFGLYGVIFYVNTIKNIIINLSKSPWLLIGLAWFGLHYAFSMTAISYGTICLVVGFFDVWEKSGGICKDEKAAFRGRLI